MIELFFIFVSFCSLFLLSLFPIRINCSGINNVFYNFRMFDFFLVNLIINISILLFLSFTNIDYSKYFILIMIISFFYNLFNFLRIKNYFKFLINKDFIFFVFLCFAIAVYFVSNPILAWDGLENWFFKAQNFFYNFNFFDLKDLKGNNNYYPHLGTFIWGFFWKNSFLQYEYFGRLFYIYIYLLSIFSICELIENKNQIKIVILSLIIILSFDEFLFRGYQEVLLFSLFIFLTKNLYFYLVNKKLINLIICYICLNLIPWTKHEGLLFTFIFSFSTLFILNHFRHKLEAIVIISLTWILLIFKSYLFYKYLDLNFTHGGGNKFFAEGKSIIEFVFLFIQGFFVAIIKYKIWIFVLFSFYFIKKENVLKINEKLLLKFLQINLVLFLSLILAIYFNLFVNSEIDFSWWIYTSLDRLLYSISGIFIIYIVFFKDFLSRYISK